MPYTIEELRRIITPIAQAHGLRSVSLFGSYSKGTARRGSDVDLKIEKGGVMSLFQLSDAGNGGRAAGAGRSRYQRRLRP